MIRCQDIPVFSSTFAFLLKAAIFLTLEPQTSFACARYFADGGQEHEQNQDDVQISIRAELLDQLLVNALTPTGSEDQILLPNRSLQSADINSELLQSAQRFIKESITTSPDLANFLLDFNGHLQALAHSPGIRDLGYFLPLTITQWLALTHQASETTSMTNAKIFARMIVDTLRSDNLSTLDVANRIHKILENGISPEMTVHLWRTVREVDFSETFVDTITGTISFSINRSFDLANSEYFQRLILASESVAATIQSAHVNSSDLASDFDLFLESNFTCLLHHTDISDLGERQDLVDFLKARQQSPSVVISLAATSALIELVHTLKTRHLTFGFGNSTFYGETDIYKQVALSIRDQFAAQLEHTKEPHHIARISLASVKLRTILHSRDLEVLVELLASHIEKSSFISLEYLFITIESVNKLGSSKFRKIQLSPIPDLVFHLSQGVALTQKQRVLLKEVFDVQDGLWITADDQKDVVEHVVKAARYPETTNTANLQLVVSLFQDFRSSSKQPYLTHQEFYDDLWIHFCVDSETDPEIEEMGEEVLRIIRKNEKQ